MRKNPAQASSRVRSSGSRRPASIRSRSAKIRGRSAFAASMSLVASALWTMGHLDGMAGGSLADDGGSQGLAASGEHELFDELVRPAEHRRWDRKAKRLSDAEIDPQLELGRLLDWEISGLGSLENLVHESRRSARCLNVVRSIGYQGAGV